MFTQTTHGNTSWTLRLVFILCSTALLVATGCAPGKFHAATITEKLLPGIDTVHFSERRFHTVRFEGKTRWESALVMTSYLRKYRNKRFPGSIAETTHWLQCHRQDPEELTTRASDSTLTLAMVGDLMWIGRPGSGFVDQELLRWLHSHDVVLANLESPVDTTRKVPSLLPDYVRYNAPPELIDGFLCSSTGCNAITAVSLANNHLFDHGPMASLNTMHFLESRGIAYTGAKPTAEAGPKFELIEAKGFCIGFYAVTYGLNTSKTSDLSEIQVNVLPGLSPFDSTVLDLSAVAAALQQMKEAGAELCIVSLHWGHEYELTPDLYQQTIAQQIVRMGADIIMGHHPHEIQPVEIYYLNGYHSGKEEGCFRQLTDESGTSRKALVAYSLGNFVTRMYTPSCRIGAMESITLYRDSQTGEILWHRNPRQYVMNEPKILPGKKHKLRLIKDPSEVVKAAPWIRP